MTASRSGAVGRQWRVEEAEADELAVGEERVVDQSVGALGLQLTREQVRAGEGSFLDAASIRQAEDEHRLAVKAAAQGIVEAMDGVSGHQQSFTTAAERNERLLDGICEGSRDRRGCSGRRRPRPANADASRAEELEASRCDGAVHAKPLGGHGQLVRESDVDVAVDALRQLGELGRLGVWEEGYIRRAASPR